MLVLSINPDACENQTDLRFIGLRVKKGAKHQHTTCSIEHSDKKMYGTGEEISVTNLIDEISSFSLLCET